MTVTPIRTRVRPRRHVEGVSTPESQEVARLEALLDDPKKAGYRAELEQELAEARKALVALTATTVLAA